MEVNFVKGDMVKHLGSDEHLDAYAHQCNCFCRMGRGIAPLLVKANPEVRAVDNETEVGDEKKMGDFSVTRNTNKPLVFNIYGQYHWSKYKVAPNRNTNYTALKEGLLKVKLHLEYLGKTTLGLPLIGCGLAGGDWKGVVLPMIEDVFQDSNIEITIFKL